jgi:hypothetical protein
MDWVRVLMLTIGAVLALAGCGGSAATHTTTGPASTKAPVQTASRIAWKPLLTLAALGEFKTRCDRNRFAVAFTADWATERVDLRINGASVRSIVLQPGQTRTTVLRPTRNQVWRILQGTEPQTIKAVVSVKPSRCPYGIPATSVSYGTAHFNSR